MSTNSDYLARLGTDLVGLAREAVNTGGVRVTVKTNFGPEFAISDGQGGGLAGLLGLQAAVIVRDKQGKRLAGYGTPPATDPVRVAVLLVVAGVLTWTLARGFRR